MNASDRIRALLAQHGEKLRFLVVGVWNTAFGLALLGVLEQSIPYDASSVFQKQGILLLNWVICVTQNFFTFKLLVFRTRGNWLQEYARMYVTYVGTFLVQSVMVQTISAQLGWSLFWSNVPTIFVVMIISYLGHKYFTFKGRHVIEAIDAGDVFTKGRGAE